MWKRLEKARGRQPTNVQEAWDSLKELGKAAAGEKKLNILVSYIKDEEDEWIDTLMTITDSIEQSKIKRRTGIPMSKGELEQIHGKLETEQFIKQGIFKKIRDKPYPQYLKVSEMVVQEKKRTMSASGTRLVQTN